MEENEPFDCGVVVDELPFFDSLAQAVSFVAGGAQTIVSKQAVGGGCINNSFMLVSQSGGRFFVKENSRQRREDFLYEAEGLQALAGAGGLAAARALAVGCEGEKAFLLLQYISPTPAAADFWPRFGERFARMHLQARGRAFGWSGRVGGERIRARNAWREGWVAFFREVRLAPQLALAGRYLDRDMRRQGERVLARLDDWIAPPPWPQLCHGDLWSGNFMVGGDGQALLIDPAVYYGHGEADLAMTQLFGGFEADFYAAYQRVNPLPRGYEARAALYNLYHLLNHLNLFGRAYLGAVAAVLRRFGA